MRTTLAVSANLAPATVTAYSTGEVPQQVQRRGTSRRQVEPVQISRLPVELTRRALALAGGDIRRLSIEPDGSIFISNTARR